VKLIPDGITSKIAREILVAKKNSPGIFFAAGIVGVLGGTVLACRATMKMGPVADELENDIKQIKEVKELYEQDSEAKYNDTDYGKDMAYAFGKAAVRTAKLYGPAIAVGIGGIALLTGSHVILVRRNAALTATVGVLAKAYDDYRARVRAEYGDEADADFALGVTEMEEVTLDDGTKAILKKFKHGHWSPYAQSFDPSNRNWERNEEYVRMFIDAQQTWANHRLRAYGHVFLNEVYDMLGMPRTPTGQLVGWVKDHGDNYIEFKLYPYQDRESGSIVIDFNVDGQVYDLI